MVPAQPFVVQFGAGAIGRGFAGQLWSDAGYEVVFVDVQPALVDALNARRSYPLRLTDGVSTRERAIGPVRALLVSDADGIADALSGCAFAATAVGAAHFPRLAPTFAAAARTSPLNVILCENQDGSGAILAAALGDAAARVGCVSAEVGRMVPVPTPELLAEDPLLILAEPYVPLVIDARAWIGPRPDLPGVSAVDDLGPAHARKLYTHNGGHALLAYLGAERGHAMVWQAAEDPELAAALRGFWDETGRAICARYGVSLESQRAFEDDLLHRFRNRALGDTVERVGRDPERKLRRDDRLVGAALLCHDHGIDPAHALTAIAAALRAAGREPAWLDAPDWLKARLG